MTDAVDALATTMPDSLPPDVRAATSSRGALTSSATDDWGTPELFRRLAAAILGAAKPKGRPPIDLDLTSSAYWHEQWAASDRPSVYLDGSPGRDALCADDVERAIAECARLRGGQQVDDGITLFDNAPGDSKGETVPRVWAQIDRFYRSRAIGTAFWQGFNLEQKRVLIPSAGDSHEFHPLHPSVGLIYPGRRVRYMARPEDMFRIVCKRLERATGAERKSLERRIRELEHRASDAPVAGPSPTHSSYCAILWSRTAATRRRQQKAACDFLRAQRSCPGSALETHALAGAWE